MPEPYGGGFWVTTSEDADVLIEQSHLAWGEFVKGNPEPAMNLFSHRDDVTVANPFGPLVRGWTQVAETMERAAALYGDGEAVTLDTDDPITLQQPVSSPEKLASEASGANPGSRRVLLPP
jgi:hypothetical protein